MLDLTSYMDDLKDCLDQSKVDSNGTKVWLSSALELVVEICNSARISEDMNVLSM